MVGIGLAAAMWWMYFDVVALVAAQRLERAAVGREQNEMARDSYSYLHFLMVAGIVLVALGVKKTLEHVDDPLKLVPAVALLGGLALYLLGHVAFRYRHTHTVNVQRAVLAALLVAAVPLAIEVSALASLAAVTVLAWLLIVYETRSYGSRRREVRHGDFTAMQEAAPRRSSRNSSSSRLKRTGRSAIGTWPQSVEDHEPRADPPALIAERVGGAGRPGPGGPRRSASARGPPRGGRGSRSRSRLATAATNAWARWPP